MSHDSTATRTLVRDGRPARRLRRFRLDITTSRGESHTAIHEAPVVRLGARPENEVVIDDETVSRLHCEIRADDAGFRLRDLGSTNGTFVEGIRVLDAYLGQTQLLRLGSSSVRFTVLGEESDIEASAADRFGPLVGGSVKMRELYAVLERVAPTTAPVLIEGDTGTGKELVARAIHDQSPRAQKPFVVFDCASVPANLMESELFGHERGAFTGATERRIGRLEDADGGTFVLDELGELPIDLQPKLLRALETRSIRRVGGHNERRIDVRIVASTNRDLASEVNRGAFREDLYYRLAVVRVEVPPLRDRRDDIRPLVEYFIRRALAGDAARASSILASISEANWKRLEAHPWPGNVRELRNVIERTIALSQSGEIETIAPPTIRASRPSTPDAGVPDLDRPFVDLKGETLARFEESYLKGQLARHDGNISRAASASGLDRMYFKRLLKKYL
jgi:DNA-binding NtrC family response regulator